MEKKRPMVSVIMLTYNHEKYIRQAIDSVLMQKVDFDYEILIGDDASTDGTVRILQEYKKKYPDIIKLYLNEVNIGATHNAYNLLINAKGKYLATCEGDDYWTDSNKLNIQILFLENNKNLIGCTHYFTVVDKKGNKYDDQYLSWIKQKDIFGINDFNGMVLPGQPSTFVRRNIIENNKNKFKYLYKIHPYVGDKVLLLIFLFNGDFGLIRKNMSCYRKSYTDNNSITSRIYNNKIDFLKEDYNMLLSLENIALENGYVINIEIGKNIIFSKCIYFFVKTLDVRYFYLAKKIVNKEYIKSLLFALKYFYTRLLKK